MAAEGEGPTPKRGGVLTIGQDENPIGLDPHKTAAFSTGNIAEHIYTCLLRWDATASHVEPDLAVAWENPDPQTFVFHLRDGVKFHNGDALTSDDVKFTFQRMVDPATRSPWSVDLLGHQRNRDAGSADGGLSPRQSVLSVPQLSRHDQIYRDRQPRGRQASAGTSSTAAPARGRSCWKISGRIRWCG